MSKKRFVQAVMARSLPTPDKWESALAYAHGLWDWLTVQGYGDDKPAEPRGVQDWYAKLDDRQKAGFNRFWNAFDLKKSRERAAMRWGQLSDSSDDNYRQIIEAAKNEARRELPPGQARKHADGWLFEKRYEDNQTPVPCKQVLQHNVIAKLSADLNSLKRLYELGKDEALLAQISKLEDAIKYARLNP